MSGWTAGKWHVAFLLGLLVFIGGWMAVYTCFWLYPFLLAMAIRNFSSSVIMVGHVGPCLCVTRWRGCPTCWRGGGMMWSEGRSRCGGCLLNFIYQRAIGSPVNFGRKAMNMSTSVHIHSELDALVESSHVVHKLSSFSDLWCQNTEISSVYRNHQRGLWAALSSAFFWKSFVKPAVMYGSDKIPSLSVCS